ncbi:hypothetical protein BJAS_P4007 [Bathymodiolus japonicus methanotrophic gill symbiont]|nr:hypothetical protein BJAS_P4007 [Bathymodiolus japonicus methanotrophic gill symbiont]
MGEEDSGGRGVWGEGMEGGGSEGREREEESGEVGGYIDERKRRAAEQEGPRGEQWIWKGGEGRGDGGGMRVEGGGTRRKQGSDEPIRSSCRDDKTLFHATWRSAECGLLNVFKCC